MLRASIVVLVVCGCSSHYMPRTPGKVAVMMRDGAVTYTRDGQSYPHGVLGHGLEDAVNGNPAAMAAANEYTSRLTTGLIAAIVGSVSTIAGTTWLGVEAAKGNSPSSSSLVAPSVSIIGGMVLMLVGVGYATSAEPYRWDAINLFNDAAMPPPGMLRPPGAPPDYGVSAKASLKMRDD